jgi:hypothetical protein
MGEWSIVFEYSLKRGSINGQKLVNRLLMPMPLRMTDVSHRLIRLVESIGLLRGIRRIKLYMIKLYLSLMGLEIGLIMISSRMIIKRVPRACEY